MSEVTVKYTFYESKKGSVRLRTNERLDQQFNLPDVYVPRSVLSQLGLTGREQDSKELTINVTYSTKS